MSLKKIVKETCDQRIGNDSLKSLSYLDGVFVK